MRHQSPVRAITLDLDDTLWPFAPVAQRIQAALEGWMAEHAPAASLAFDPTAVREALDTVRRERPDIAHDLGACRREALCRMLSAAGENPALADDAFAVIYEARQQVDHYEDVGPALDRLSAHVPLLALTNGNADLQRTGVAHWFVGCVSAGDTGVGKPDARIFLAACERLSLPPADVLHVGDDLALDVDGALRAGMQAAWVHRDLEGDAPVEALHVRDLLALADALGTS
ncbi:MAG TPA: HAD-IA family hydrolase [Baekduia sp.]|nr:HAD-IA family hydrolase [Baekduia sp.]